VIVADRLLNPFMKVWYWYLSRWDKNAEVTFLNYGYVDGQRRLKLKEEDETDRYSIQLYDYVAGTISLRGLDVLEVSCGRGGGASYIARYLEPRSVTGVDICREAVKFCKEHYSVEGLSFSCGNALSLPFADNSFDVVINVEASHRYADMNRFLREVHRVLKPGGYFLFADFRRRKSIDSLRKQLSSSGLTITTEQRITSNVIEALNSDHERKADLIRESAPRLLRKLAVEFAGTKGTGLYRSFVSGEREYLHFALQKRLAVRDGRASPVD
jgi:ubiquinone/menaquinone biosynthesis C-methylase UbiE